MKEKITSIQEWIPIDRFLDDGIIKLKNNKFIKIIKIIPINFNLKSDLEKNAILNSYKIFLKTCNFDIQILIQSNKKNLSKHISNIEKNIKKEKNLEKISKDYIKYINNLNSNKKADSKNFYIIISNNKNDSEEIIMEELNEKYFKIKECLSRCGNIVNDFSDKKEIINIIYYFLNYKK